MKMKMKMRMRRMMTKAYEDPWAIQIDDSNEMSMLKIKTKNEYSRVVFSMMTMMMVTIRDDAIKMMKIVYIFLYLEI